MRMASPGDFVQKAKWQLQLRLSKSDWNTAIWPPCQVLLSPSEKPKCCTNFWSYRRKRQPFSSSFQPQGQGSSLSSCFWLCHKVSALPPNPWFPITSPSFLMCTEGTHFHPCVSCLEMKSSEVLQRLQGCSHAPLTQSRKQEDAEARTAGQASISDKYNKSRPAISKQWYN